MRYVLITFCLIIGFNTYGQDTIVTKDNKLIPAKNIVRKNVPTEDPAKWVSGMYYTDVNGERVNIKDEKVEKIRLQKLPTDMNNDVVFKKEIVFKNSPKNKIYDKVKVWVADTWVNANEVIQVDNQQGGTVLLKGNSTISIPYLLNGNKFGHYLKYTAHIEITNNKVKIQFKNLTTQHLPITTKYAAISGPVESAENYNYYVSIFEMTVSDMENFANASDKKKAKDIKKAYRTIRYKKHYKGGVDKIAKHVNGLILLFEKDMLELDSEEYTMTSDEALEELKKWKSKLDLELITKDEYDIKKAELSKLIK